MLAALAMVVQLALGSVAPADRAVASESVQLAGAGILCGAPVQHPHRRHAACPQQVALDLPAAVPLTPVAILPAPPLRAGDPSLPPPARAPPAHRATVAQARAPPARA